MARIAGVDLPNKKRIEYGLTYIYGIGLYKSRQILDAAGISYDKRVFELSEDEAAAIRKEIQEHHMEVIEVFAIEKAFLFADKRQKLTQELEKADVKPSARLLSKARVKG